jgi:hypothetical protein
VLGGVQAQVVTGRATKFERFYNEGQTVGGSIVTIADDKPVKGGKVILRVSTRGHAKTFNYQEAKVANGSFTARLKYQGTEVKAFYVPLPELGECESETLKI